MVWKNLIIEGGGVRIVAIGGTLRALERRGALSKITKYGGTSAGAMVAAGLAIGYTGCELANLFATTDMFKFADDDRGYGRDTYRVFKHWGVYKGRYLDNHINNIVCKKVGSPLYTFRNLHDDKGVDLVLVSTNVNQDKPYYLSRYTSPDMPIAKAVRMSMSIPFGFIPVKHEECWFVDGGVSDNYPLHMFDGNYPNEMHTMFKESNPETLGLKLMGEGERRDHRIHHTNTEINNIIDFSSSLVVHMMNRIERLSISPEYWDRTITVPTGSIGTTDFDISKKDIIKSQRAAYVSTIKQLDARRSSEIITTDDEL